MKKINLLLLIVIISIILRIIFLFKFVDLNSDHYQEYGYIAYNIVNDRGYSLNYHNANEYRPYFNIDEKPFQSAYMPPAYVYYIVPFLEIDNIWIRNVLLYSSQIILSIFVLIMIYYLTKDIFNEKVALIASFIYAVFPEFIFTIGVSGPVVHFHLAIIAILYVFHKENLTTYKQIILLSLLFAIGIYLRSDFLLYFMILMFYLIYKKNYKNAILVTTFVAILLSPWQIRNYMIFDEPVITTNGGFNIYRGHYPGSSFKFLTGDDVQQELKANFSNPKFDLIQNKVFNKYAVKYFKENLAKDTFEGIVNIFKFIFIQTEDPRSTNPLYFIPWLIMLPLSIYGMIKSRGLNINTYIYLYIIINIAIVFIFFAIPRYQTLAKIVLVPYFAFGIVELMKIKLFPNS